MFSNVWRLWPLRSSSQSFPSQAFPPSPSLSPPPSPPLLLCLLAPVLLLPPPFSRPPSPLLLQAPFLSLLLAFFPLEPADKGQCVKLLNLSDTDENNVGGFRFIIMMIGLLLNRTTDVRSSSYSILALYFLISDKHETCFKLSAQISIVTFAEQAVHVINYSLERTKHMFFHYNPVCCVNLNMRELRLLLNLTR